MSKYHVIETIKVRTTTGIRELQTSEVVTLPEHLAEPLLAAGRIKRIVPYFDASGDLVIPFGCDSRYHYWQDGFSIETTEKELNRGLLN